MLRDYRDPPGSAGIHRDLPGSAGIHPPWRLHQAITQRVRGSPAPPHPHNWPGVTWTEVVVVETRLAVVLFPSAPMSWFPGPGVEAGLRDQAGPVRFGVRGFGFGFGFAPVSPSWLHSCESPLRPPVPTTSKAAVSSSSARSRQHTTADASILNPRESLAQQRGHSRLQVPVLSAQHHRFVRFIYNIYFSGYQSAQ